MLSRGGLHLVNAGLLKPQKISSVSIIKPPEERKSVAKAWIRSGNSSEWTQLTSWYINCPCIALITHLQVVLLTHSCIRQVCDTVRALIGLFLSLPSKEISRISNIKWVLKQKTQHIIHRISGQQKNYVAPCLMVVNHEC